MCKRLVILLAALAMLATACSPEESAVTSTRPTIPAQPGRVIPATELALQPFDACVDLLDYVQSHALDLVTPWGLDSVGFPVAFTDVALAERAVEDSAPAAGGDAGSDFSGTNVQVAGVDEPDLVKTDGTRIVAIAKGRLVYVDITTPQPVQRGSLAIADGSINDMLIAGDRVLLFGYSNPGSFAEPTRGGFYPHWSPTSMIIEVDISDPDNLRILSTLRVDGATVASRMVGSTVRVVIDSFPTGIEFVFPEGAGLKAERDALEENRRIIRETTVDNWIPYFVLETADGAETEGLLVDCANAHQPNEFSGLGMLAILTIDLSDGLSVDSTMGIYADGHTVYASAESLYVAMTKWINWEELAEAAESRPDFAPPKLNTQIHRFDISSPAVTMYVASGEVEGTLLNQFSMDEFQGNLRVASTTDSMWWDASQPSESRVTVLADDGEGTLEAVGLVTGLGETERIFAVRFMGNLGYVVTFRQTDPLYTLDLSNPTDPKAVGELKINGYSAYLHPIADGYLLGVGQDATDEGRTLGTQVSLFDVRNPAEPVRIFQQTIDDAYSSVEFDHRAFLHWPATGTVVIPINTWSFEDDKEEFFTGAAAFKVDPTSGIQRIGDIIHNATGDEVWQGTIYRSVVVGDTLYTISELGLEATGLADMSELSFLRWGA